ncbi:MAG: carbohydrate-binding family 9-like protein, partial [Candidatus Latescibacterota bacterium]|nr:carbohydrate-binding family 9-like protein [Candidatus Latescibacterota bacterium]
MRVEKGPTIDGHLDEPSWLAAPRSPRFRDMTHGGPAVHDTRTAVLWDDTNLYVGFWIEEPFVEATLKNRDDPIYQNNDVEVFIAGQDTYYEFEINAYGTVYEVLFVWEDAYERDGYDQEPGLARNAPGAQPFYGVGLKDH